LIPENTAQNKALDAEPPIASFLKSMLIGGGPVNAAVRRTSNSVAEERAVTLQHATLAKVTSRDITGWCGDGRNCRSLRTLNEQPDSRDFKNVEWP
jgi:hypothetical protein